MGVNTSQASVHTSILQHIIDEKAILKMIADPIQNRLRQAVQRRLFKELQDIITPAQMLSVCDSSGISDKGYKAIYQCVTRGLRAKGLNRSLLPTPYNMIMARKLANRDVCALFGGYKWVEDAMPMSSLKSFAATPKWQQRLLGGGRKR